MERTEYVVYSRDGFNVGLCSRTRPLSEASMDLADLATGQAPPWVEEYCRTRRPSQS